jgi:hypothetical protein
MGHNTLYIPPKNTLSYVALLTQNGGTYPQSQTSGSLVIGRTYYVYYNGFGDDFSNVGGRLTASGYYFIATGTTPTNWTHGSVLNYTDGAPVVLSVVENTFYDSFESWNGLYFTADEDGTYYFNSSFPLFPQNRTIVDVTNPTDGSYVINAYRTGDTEIRISTLVNQSAQADVLNPQNGAFAEASWFKVTVYPTTQ